MNISLLFGCKKTVNIPNDTDGKTVRLFMERVNIASELWIDGVKTDRQIIELSTPHIYNLTGKNNSGRTYVYAENRQQKFAKP